MGWIERLRSIPLTGPEACWRRPGFWLMVAAIVLPFGVLLLTLRLEPVRVRVRSLYDRAYRRRLPAPRSAPGLESLAHVPGASFHAGDRGYRARRGGARTARREPPARASARAAAGRPRPVRALTIARRTRPPEGAGARRARERETPP